MFKLPKYCPKPNKHNLATQYYYWNRELIKENRELQKEKQQLQQRVRDLSVIETLRKEKHGLFEAVQQLVLDYITSKG